MTTGSHLRHQASTLFQLAMQAFQRGDSVLGDELTARALQYLDEAKAADATPPSPPASADPSRQPAQQQQQRPPKTDDDSKD